MSSLFETLSTKKFNLSGNIDERYFTKNDDGTYKATPLFIHNVARDIIEDIKKIIIESNDSTYVTHSNNKGQGYTEVDTWAWHFHEGDWNTKYKDLIAKEAEMWKEYQKSHLDEFNQNKPTVAVGDIPTTRFFSAYQPEFKGKSNYDLMTMYKEALELHKRYEDDEDLRQTLPLRPGNLVSKPEFKELHAKIRKANKEKLGLPEDTTPKPMVKIAERASLIKSNTDVFKNKLPKADGSAFEDYIKGLVEWITSSTPEQHQKEYEELHTHIEDVCDGFTRGGRGTKLVISRSNIKEAMNISIYTSDKGDGSNRRRLANISKVNPGDPYYTFTLYITSGGKRPIRRISTKAEFRSTLEDLIEVLEDNDLHEYVDCVQNAIDTLL